MTTESTRSGFLWVLLVMISLINKTHGIYADIKDFGAKADGHSDNSKVNKKLKKTSICKSTYEANGVFVIVSD